MLSTPTTANELQICVGIDISKSTHTAAFISPTLLRKHRHFEACPTKNFDNTRIGFEELLQAMQSYAPLSQCCVLMERTGHYHRALQSYLMEHDIAVYEIQVRKQPRRNKSDKRDALGLANSLYNQAYLGVQVDEPDQRIRALAAPSMLAVQLRGLTSRRYALEAELTQRRNQLTAIADQVFPEMSMLIKDVNGPSALRLRSKFPTPAMMAAAPLEDLKECCPGVRPSRAVLSELQKLAARSIGIKDIERIEALIFSQAQLIEELRLLQSHIEAIEARIEKLMVGSREGKILTSLPMISTISAAAIIGNIGNIENFRDAKHLRSYFGWAPHEEQTGTTTDYRVLNRGGNHTMKLTMYLIGWSAIRMDTEWRDLYRRLVPLKCQWDARKKVYRGKNKVIGRIIGQIISLIYHLLSKDYDLIASLEPGEAWPEPTLYDREVHQAHRRSHGKQD
jgi:transposase